MKAVLEKIIAATLVSVTFVFVLFVMLTSFGWLETLLFDNQIVRVLLSILALFYIVLSALLLYVVFSSKRTLKQLLLFCDRGSCTNASLDVIKSVVSNSMRYSKGVFVKRVTVVQEEGSKVKMQLQIKVDGNVKEKVDFFRVMLIDNFKQALGVVFASIDFKIVALKSNYKPDENSLKTLSDDIARTQQKMEEISSQAENLGEASKSENTSHGEGNSNGENDAQSENFLANDAQTGLFEQTPSTEESQGEEKMNMSIKKDE